MWIESIADGKPNKVVTSPIFMGLTTSVSGEYFIQKVADNFIVPSGWLNGMVKDVSMCRFPSLDPKLRRFEGVIDREYSQNKSPTINHTNAYRYTTYWHLLKE